MGVFRQDEQSATQSLINENAKLLQAVNDKDKELFDSQELVADLMDVVRDCVNFLADLDTKSDRAKALHKRAYTAHSKAKEK